MRSRSLILQSSILALGASTLHAGMLPFEYEIRGLVSSSLIDGVNENDEVSLIFIVDPTLEPTDFDDRRGNEESGQGVFAGATLVSLTINGNVYTGDASTAQVVTNGSPDEYFTEWGTILGPAPVGLVPEQLRLALEGGNDPLSTVDRLPTAEEFNQLATEGTGVLRFQELPSRSTGITPTIVFNTIPSPSAAALLGVATLGALRRRRSA